MESLKKRGRKKGKEGKGKKKRAVIARREVFGGGKREGWRKTVKD